MEHPLQPCTYILAKRRYGTLYVGVTSNLLLRMEQHAEGLFPGFTKTHGICQLVYYEMHASMPQAIAREKLLKRWHRPWKYRLIEQMNPEWCNLYNQTNNEIVDGPADLARR